MASAADYGISVLGIVIAGSLSRLHIAEIVEEHCDHCMVRVFRSPPRDDGMDVYAHSIVWLFMCIVQGWSLLACSRIAVMVWGLYSRRFRFQSWSPPPLTLGYPLSARGESA